MMLHKVARWYVALMEINITRIFTKMKRNKKKKTIEWSWELEAEEEKE